MMNNDGIKTLSALVLEQNQFYEPTKKDICLGEAKLFVAVVQQAINDLKYVESEDPDLRHIGEDAKSFLSEESRVGSYFQYLGINYNWFKRKMDILLSL